MRKFITFIILISVFLDSVILIRKPVNLFVYYLFYLIFIVVYVINYKNVKINRSFLLLLIFLTIISSITCLLAGSNVLLVYKQLFAIGFSSLTFYLFISYCNYDLSYIYRSYIKIAFVVALIGLFQEFFYVIDFTYGYDYSYILSYWRKYDTELKYYLKVNSIVSEPAHFAIAMAPALFTSANRLLRKNTFVSKPKAMLIIFVYVLSGSALGMISIALAVCMVFYKQYLTGFKGVMKGKPVLYIIPLLIMTAITAKLLYELPFIKLRVDDTYNLLVSNNPKSLAKKLNFSTFAIYSNFLVAKDSFLQNPFFGSGLGTHSNNYDLYIGRYFNSNLDGVKNALNKEDGSTLLIRVISELGIFGVLVIAFFLKKNYIKTQVEDEVEYELWLINQGAFLMFLLKILRHGNYSLLGFFLFVFLYYFSHKQLLSKRNAPGEGGSLPNTRELPT